MSCGSKSKPEGARHSLLSPQESEKLEELLGRRCAVSSEMTVEGIVRCENDILL